MISVEYLISFVSSSFNNRNPCSFTSPSRMSTMSLLSCVSAETISRVHFEINQISLNGLSVAQIRRFRFAIPFNVRAIRIDQLCLEPFRHDLLVVGGIWSVTRCVRCLVSALKFRTANRPTESVQISDPTRALSCCRSSISTAVVEPNETTVTVQVARVFPRCFRRARLYVTNVTLRTCFLFEGFLCCPVSNHLITLALATSISVASVEISVRKLPHKHQFTRAHVRLERAAGVTDPGNSSPALEKRNHSIQPPRQKRG